MFDFCGMFMDVFFVVDFFFILIEFFLFVIEDWILFELIKEGFVILIINKVEIYVFF